MPPPYHRAQLATPPVLVQRSTRRSIYISDIPTRPAHGPMVCRTPAPLAPPPSKLARYALQMRLFVGYSGTTLGRRGPPSGCCHSFPSGQFWLRETRGGGIVAQVQRKTCPVVARIRIRIRIAFAPPHDCRSPQFNATQAEGGRMDSPGGKDSL